MKKSEAIKIISDFIDIQILTGRHLTGKNILDLVETGIGMTPPMYWDDKDPEYGKETWEPEDAR